MLGIPTEIVEHNLNIVPGSKPVKQALRRFSNPKRKAMGEELTKLLEVGFILYVKHTDWLSNLSMVPKKDKSWYLCVDFKDINKVCPKDMFTLSCIDQVVDATSQDVYSGYHQIKMRY